MPTVVVNSAKDCEREILKLLEPGWSELLKKNNAGNVVYGELFNPIYHCFKKHLDANGAVDEDWFQVARLLYKTAKTFKELRTPNFRIFLRCFVQLAADHFCLARKGDDCGSFILYCLSGYLKFSDVFQPENKGDLLAAVKACSRAVRCGIKTESVSMNQVSWRFLQRLTQAVEVAKGNKKAVNFLDPDVFDELVRLLGLTYNTVKHASTFPDFKVTIQTAAQVLDCQSFKLFVRFGELLKGLKEGRCAVELDKLEAEVGNVGKLVKSDPGEMKAAGIVVKSFFHDVYTAFHESYIRVKSSSDDVPSIKSLLSSIGEQNIGRLITVLTQVFTILDEVYPVSDLSECRTTGDHVLTIFYVFLYNCSACLRTMAKDKDGTSERVIDGSNEALGSKLMDLFEAGLKRLRSYKCWSEEDASRQSLFSSDLLIECVTRVRASFYFVSYGFILMWLPKPAFWLSKLGLDWRFVPCHPEAEEKLRNVLNGMTEPLKGYLTYPFQEFVLARVVKKDQVAVTLDFFSHALHVLFMVSKSEDRYGKKPNLNAFVDNVAKCWYRCVTITPGFTEAVKDRFSSGASGGKKLACSSLAWLGHHLHGRDKDPCADLLTSLIIVDLDYCLLYPMSKIPDRAEVIPYLFDRGLEHAHKTKDIVNYSRISARVARAIFFTPSDSGLVEMGLTSVTKTLEKALRYCERLGTVDLALVTKAEVKLSVWMMCHLKAKKRVHDELGYHMALKLAYECQDTTPNSKLFGSVGGSTSVAERCMALRYSRQIEDAKHLVEALNLLKLVPIDMLLKFPGLGATVEFLANMIGLNGMISEEREVRKLHFEMCKQDSSCNLVEAAVSLMMADPSQVKTVAFVEETAEKNFKAKSRNSTAISELILFRTETARALMKKAGTKKDGLKKLAETVKFIIENDALLKNHNVSSLTWVMGHFLCVLASADQTDEVFKGLSLPSPRRLLSNGMKSILISLRASPSTMATFSTQILCLKAFYNDLDDLVTVAYLKGERRTIESYSLHGWFIAVAMALPYRCISSMLSFCESLQFSIRQYPTSGMWLLDIFGALFYSSREEALVGLSETVQVSKVSEMKYAKKASKMVKPQHLDFQAGEDAYSVSVTRKMAASEPVGVDIFLDDDSIFTNSSSEDEASPEDKENESFLKDKLDLTLKTALEKFHPLKCTCREQCSFEFLSVGYRAALLWFKQMVFLGKDPQIRSTLETLRFVEQKLLARCDGDLSKIEAPLAVQKLACRTALYVIDADRHYDDAGKLKLTPKSDYDSGVSSILEDLWNAGLVDVGGLSRIECSAWVAKMNRKLEGDEFRGRARIDWAAVRGVPIEGASSRRTPDREPEATPIAKKNPEAPKRPRKPHVGREDPVEELTEGVKTLAIDKKGTKNKGKKEEASDDTAPMRAPVGRAPRKRAPAAATKTGTPAAMKTGTPAAMTTRARAARTPAPESTPAKKTGGYSSSSDDEVIMASPPPPPRSARR